MKQYVVSTKTLVKSTIVATVMAVIVLVCFILPAEFNIDPTHIGHKLGLTVLAHNKSKGAETAITVTANFSELAQDVIEVVVPVGTGRVRRCVLPPSKSPEFLAVLVIANGCPGRVLNFSARY